MAGPESSESNKLPQTESKPEDLKAVPRFKEQEILPNIATQAVVQRSHDITQDDSVPGGIINTVASWGFSLFFRYLMTFLISIAGRLSGLTDRTTTGSNDDINTVASWSFSLLFRYLMTFLIGIAGRLSGLNNLTTTDSNVSGTERAFRATGDGSVIEAKNATINAGYRAGNPKHSTDSTEHDLKGCSGTNDAFNADCGGKINLDGVTVNSGAFSGIGIREPKRK